jgi:hypothetical protein
MKALTLWRPWPAAIFYLGKNVENRTWPAPDKIIGKRIAIHSGQREDTDALPFIYNAMSPQPQSIFECIVILNGIKEVDYKGAIIGTVIIERCCRYRQVSSKWAEGPYCWLLEDPIILPEPILCKGAQGLWEVPAEIASLLGDPGLLKKPRKPTND